MPACDVSSHQRYYNTKSGMHSVGLNINSMKKMRGKSRQGRWMCTQATSWNVVVDSN
jgi:hypothetical protein